MGPDVEEQVRSLREYLAIYEALVAAQDRRREVFDVVESAQNTDVAIAALSNLLGIGGTGALAVMDMQLRRLTVDERSKIRERCDEVRRQLELILG